MNVKKLLPFLLIAFIALMLFVPLAKATLNHYWLNGPYSEDGAWTVVGNMTATSYGASPNTFNLNGSWYFWMEGLTAEGLPDYFRFWIINSTLSRYYLPLDDNETIYAFQPETPFGVYYVEIVDTIGIQNATLEAYVTLNGTNYAVEREPVTPGNLVPFVLTQFATYGFKLRCSEGIVDFGRSIIGDPTQTLIFTVSGFNFPSTAINYGNLTLSATRMNGSWIQIGYDDSGNNTNSVVVSIQNVQTGTVEYNTTFVSSSFSVNWYDALANYDYVVTLAVNHAVYGNISWRLPASYGHGVSSPFDLGFMAPTLPFRATDIIGFCIIMFIFACGSVKDSGMMLIVTVVVAGFLALIGWVSISAVSIAVVLCLAVAYAISKRRYG